MNRRFFSQICTLRLFLALGCSLSVEGFANEFNFSEFCMNFALKSISEPKRQSPIEFEPKFNEESLRLITTQEGTLGGMKKGIREYTGNYFEFYFNEGALIEWYQKNFPLRKGTYETLRWDELTTEQKVKLIEITYKPFDTSGNFLFSMNLRKIPGLQIRETLPVQFTETTVFMGKTYSPGVHEIDTTAFLMPEVEWLSAETVGKPLLRFEFHVRSKGHSAVEIGNHADQFLKLMNMGELPRHQYTIGTIPVAKLVSDPESVSLQLTLFVNATELTQEVYTVIERGSTLKPNGADFPLTEASDLIAVQKYFLEIGKSGKLPKHSPKHKGWTGFRGHEAFDEPGLFGIEFRNLFSGQDRSQRNFFLSNAQHTLETGDFGFPLEKVKRWQNTFGTTGNPNFEAALLSWNKPLQSLYDHGSPSARAFIEKNKPWLEKFETSSRTTINGAPAQQGSQAWRMLLFDWTKHPLFFEDLAAVRKIEAVQKKALGQFHENYNPRDVVKNFLVESGIWEALVKTRH